MNDVAFTIWLSAEDAAKLQAMAAEAGVEPHILAGCLIRDVLDDDTAMNGLPAKAAAPVANPAPPDEPDRSIFSAAELRTLKALRQMKYRPSQMATAMGRTVYSILNALRELP